jgi:transcriptional regulator with XRE-family HTH domain
MRLARRIRQLRFEHLLSLEELAPQARMSATLLVKIENGQEIPSLEMVDNLAAAMGVRAASLFYDDLGPAMTPWLTARLTLQQLAEEPFHSRSSHSASLMTFKRLRAFGAELFSLITADRRHLLGTPPPSHFPTTNSRKQNGTDSSTRWKDTKPKP